ncbi:UNKNOWN [Stylonychia lemnae]|uniref:Uncharacterized protein n=1 Tax=Stylonychia lemnae TaxID=5949 RepID=A0A078AMK1_STYLE|nr:UNKNOWN [Stylonychia lemnae]|eukprot:CDW82093.1 UNKNOWN [Stylonychia lemnae]
MEEQSFEGEIAFNTVDYLVGVRQIQQTAFDPLNQRLYVEVEEKLTGNIWKGDFQAKYIEDIANKTGVPKKFNVFVKMLIQALRSQNESVCIDLLTFADLEALKTKGQSANNRSNLNQTTTNNKRYFILTYITEFERVHYPLSLNYVEEPETDQLRRTIERMRNMILMQKSNTFSNHQQPFGGLNTNNFSQTAYNKIDDFTQIEQENDNLKRQITDLESQFSQSHQEFFSLSQQKFYTESEYDKYKRNAQREILTLQEQVRNAEGELQQLQEQLKEKNSVNGSNRITQTSGFSLNSGQVQGSQISDMDHVKRQLEDVSHQLEQERSTTGSMIDRQDKEIEECKKELEDQRENEKKLKARQKELQDELDQTLKRIEQLQRGVSTPVRRRPVGGYGTTGSGNGSKNASPYSRNSSNSKKQATPTNYNKNPVTNNVYNRNRVGSNGRTTGVTGPQRQSPATQNRFGNNKPPSQVRQPSNTRQSPTTYNRNPVQRQPYQRNTSNNRSGSLNNRAANTTNQRSTNGTNYGQNKQVAQRVGANQKSTTNSGVYDRLYGNKSKPSSLNNAQSNERQQQDYQIAERDNQPETVNINIIGNQQSKKILDNKENQLMQSNSSNNGGGSFINRHQDNFETANAGGNNYDDVDVKDINSKLSRLQDLLQKAKQT